MKVALVCIAKLEDNYIDEWIDYHLKLGFDDIFVYENNWRYNKDREHVIKIPVDGVAKQIVCYNKFIQKYTGEYDWAAFMDVDEFLVLKKHKNIKNFISDYLEYNAIGINWCLFGDNNLDEPTDDYSVLKRFTKREKKTNKHVKTIVKLNRKIIMFIHNTANTKMVDTNRNLFRGPFNPNGDNNIAQINHYFVKTKKEFIEKCNRGQADSSNLRPFSDFEKHNFNDIDDFDALNFYNDKLFYSK
jgi:hypothetical protein